MNSDPPFPQVSAALGNLPAFVAVALVAGFLAAVAVLVLVPRAIRAKRLKRERSEPLPGHGATAPAVRLDGIGFVTTPVLNRQGARLLAVLEAALAETGGGYRIMAQTSLAELLRPKPGSLDDETHQRVLATLAPRRVDFAVFDRWGHLALAIEFQGLSSASTRDFVRDAIKRDAIRNAQVPVLEIGVDYSEDEVVASLRSILKRRRSPVGVQARA